MEIGLRNLEREYVELKDGNGIIGVALKGPFRLLLARIKFIG